MNRLLVCCGAFLLFVGDRVAGAGATAGYLQAAGIGRTPARRHAACKSL